MKETGQTLKKARESQNISLSAVSAVTKINVKILEAIESADEKTLPSKTFLRGFVQTYSNFLKLDTPKILDSFQKEMGTTTYTPVITETNEDGTTPGDGSSKEEKIPAISTEKPQSLAEKTQDVLEQREGSKVKKYLSVALAIILIIAIYVISEVVHKYQKESEVQPVGQEVQSNAIDPKSKPVESDVKPTEAVHTQPEAKPIEVKPTPTTPTEQATEKAPTKTPEKPAAAVAPPPATSETAATTPPTSTEAPKPLVTPSAESAANKTFHEVIIEALDAVKIDFRIDGGALQTTTLQVEEKRTFRAKKSLAIDVSDGGAINVNYNGKDNGVPGNLGQPMKLSFP